MTDDEHPKATPVEELTQRCGHECLMPPDHEGIHQYGYIGGPYSYKSLLAKTELRPAESLALKVALNQMDRCDQPTENIAAVCILALARVSGVWTADEEQTDD